MKSLQEHLQENQIIVENSSTYSNGIKKAISGFLSKQQDIILDNISHIISQYSKIISISKSNFEIGSSKVGFNCGNISFQFEIVYDIRYFTLTYNDKSEKLLDTDFKSIQIALENLKIIDLLEKQTKNQIF